MIEITTLEQFIETLPWQSVDADLVCGLENRINLGADAIGSNRIELNAPSRLLSRALTAEESTQLSRLLLAETLNKKSRSDILDERAMQIDVQESCERMVSIENLARNRNIDIRFSDRTFTQYAEGGWANQRRIFHVREQVANHITDMALAANKMGLIMQIEDGFRPEGVLRGLLRSRIESTALENPQLSFEQMKSEIAARTALYQNVAGHSFGAAVDFTLLKENGEPLDLGNKYGQGGPLVPIDSPFVTFEQWSTRQIFNSLCEMRDGLVYPEEDWHVSWGDPLGLSTLDDSLRESAVACYGPIKSFDASGIVEPYEYLNGSAQIMNDDEIRLIINETLNAR